MSTENLNNNSSNSNWNEYNIYVVKELERLQKTAEKQNELLSEILIKLTKLEAVEDDIKSLKGFNKQLTDIYSIQDLNNLKRDVDRLKKLRDYGIGIMMVVSFFVQLIIRAIF